ncbi:MAG: hypothetical protein AB8G23_21730 [Myxococcota bacterium]
MNVSHFLFRRIAPVMLGLALAPMASASGGAFEISQACAVSTGCFPGDSPGYPVTINAGGAYRLTSNLRVTDAADVGIQVTASHVDLDLNGFSLSCAEFTPPFSVTPCSDTQNASGNGIQALSPVKGLSVRNGTVRDMAANGLSVHDAQISSLTVMGNSRAGILLGGGLVEKSNVYDNQLNGIWTLSASRVAGNVVRDNGGVGILSGQHSAVIGNVAVGNGLSGISATNSIISQNSSSENGTSGIFASGGSVHSNVVDSNSFGLSLGGNAGYRDNTISGNSTDDVTGTGVNLGDNVCGSLLCP